MDYDIRDINLAEKGRLRIEWAGMSAPVLGMIKERFSKEKPLEGRRLSACLHITTETALLLKTLKAGGAEVVDISSQDELHLLLPPFLSERSRRKAAAPPHASS